MIQLTRFKKIAIVALLAAIIILPVFAEQRSIPASNGQATTYIFPMEDWIRNDDVNTIKLINILLDEDVPVYWALDNFTVGGTVYPAGSFYIKTPFITRRGVSSDVIMNWLMWQSKLTHVWRIDTTAESFTVTSKQLVLPRVVLFYDTTTYENALMHYLRFRSLGFKVVLANAVDLYAKAWNESGSVLDGANVFVMPGGAVHFWAFPDMDTMAAGIGNITDFVKNGGGYIGVCAGTVEALSTTGYGYLEFVNATMYDGVRAQMNAEDWKILQGPMYVQVEEPNNPVMFGYGSDAVRPGYGPKPTIYYLGGPAMYDVTNATVLGTYYGPVTQYSMPTMANQWGAAAVITADYYNGKVVVFGPHPEYPGPCARMYAQALYYTANIEKPSPFDPPTNESMSEAAISECVGTIKATVAQIKPVLEESTRLSAQIVNMRIGDIYSSLGIAIDNDLLSFSKELYSELNDIQRYAVKFQYEFSKLNALKGMVGNDAQLLSLIEQTQAMISSFFNLTLNLPQDQHVIAETSWTGIPPFPPFTQADEAAEFDELINAFLYVNNETRLVLVPRTEEFVPIMREYDNLRIQNKTAFTPEVNATLNEMLQNITSYYPAGIYYQVVYTFFHTLDVVQYKIAYHIFNLLTLADRTSEVISHMEFALASSVGQWNYALAELQAFFAHPEGAFL
jgi:glutamine amidotransferase-like uncharacterized protein